MVVPAILLVIVTTYFPHHSNNPCLTEVHESNNLLMIQLVTFDVQLCVSALRQGTIVNSESVKKIRILKSVVVANCNTTNLKKYMKN